jgi:hypothetical protein
MDPSLREIIAQAVTAARKGGQDAAGQRGAAVALLAAVMPSLDPGTAQLIVEQLYPLITDIGAAA